MGESIRRAKVRKLIHCYISTADLRYLQTPVEFARYIHLA